MVSLQKVFTNLNKNHNKQLNQTKPSSRSPEHGQVY